MEVYFGVVGCWLGVPVINFPKNFCCLLTHCLKLCKMIHCFSRKIDILKPGSEFGDPCLRFWLIDPCRVLVIDFNASVLALDTFSEI